MRGSLRWYNSPLHLHINISHFNEAKPKDAPCHHFKVMLQPTLGKGTLPPGY